MVDYDLMAKNTRIKIALEAINRPKPYRPLKVVAHDPLRNPRATTSIKGWITSEIFLLGRTPEEMEKMLGFDSRPGKEYLPKGIDVFEFTQKILAADIELGGAYTHLPGGKPWDGKDLHWPPGTGAVQWKLIQPVPCKFMKTVPRGTKFV